MENSTGYSRITRCINRLVMTEGALEARTIGARIKMRIMWRHHGTDRCTAWVTGRRLTAGTRYRRTPIELGIGIITIFMTTTTSHRVSQGGVVTERSAPVHVPYIVVAGMTLFTDEAVGRHMHRMTALADRNG